MKKYITLLLLCFAFISISGCEADRNAIYDDDAKIVQSSDSHYANMSVYSVDGNEFSMTARTFTGAKTIWRYNPKNECEVTFSYSLSVSEGGKAKLVLITPDDEIILLAENMDNADANDIQSQTVSLKKGNNRIKIVGYDGPSLNLVLNVDVGDLVGK